MMTVKRPMPFGMGWASSRVSPRYGMTKPKVTSLPAALASLSPSALLGEMGPWTATPWSWRTSILRSLWPTSAPVNSGGSGISMAPGPGSKSLSDLFSSGKISRNCSVSSRICRMMRAPSPIVMTEGSLVRSSAWISARAPLSSGIANGSVPMCRPCQSVTAA